MTKSTGIPYNYGTCILKEDPFWSAYLRRKQFLEASESRCLRERAPFLCMTIIVNRVAIDYLSTQGHEDLNVWQPRSSSNKSLCTSRCLSDKHFNANVSGNRFPYSSIALGYWYHNALSTSCNTKTTMQHPDCSSCLIARFVHSKHSPTGKTATLPLKLMFVP